MKEIHKKLEKEVKKDVEKEVKEEVEQKLGKKLDKKTEKNLKKDMDKEVQKRLADRLKNVYKTTFDKTKKNTLAFKEEFKKHSVTAIAAAFAFLIALSWKTPIQNTVDSLVKKLNLGALTSMAIFLEYITAIIITVIAVLALMWMAKWSSKDKN